MLSHVIISIIGQGPNCKVPRCSLVGYSWVASSIPGLGCNNAKQCEAMLGTSSPKNCGSLKARKRLAASQDWFYIQCQERWAMISMCCGRAKRVSRSTPRRGTRWVSLLSCSIFERMPWKGEIGVEAVVSEIWTSY